MFSYKSLVSFWDRFFFEKKSVDGLAIFRIVWLSILLVYFLVDVTNLKDFYGPHAILSQDTVRSHFNYLHANIFYFFKPSYEVTYALAVVYGMALFMSLIGFFTRISLFIALILMTSFHQRNIWLLSSSEALMRIMMILLLCSPCGHALSVDSLLGKRFPQFKKPKEWPVWSLRLIQIQLSVVYLMTVWQKLKGDSWFDGTAVYYATRLDSMTNFTVPYLLDNMVFIRLMTWGTLLIEVALGTLIWFKEFRKPVILIGILFHLGIEYMMSIPFFEINMIALLINFYTPEEHHAFALRVKQYIADVVKESALGDSIKERFLGAIRG